MDDIVSTNIPKYHEIQSAADNKSIIFIRGPSSTGKTFLARKALSDDRSIVHVYIDCNLITNPSKFYIKILNSLRTKLRLPKLMRRCQDIKVLSFLDFRFSFESDIVTRIADRKIYIILDDVDIFTGTSMLDCLVALSNTKKLNLLLISVDNPNDFLAGIRSQSSRKNIHDRLSIIQLFLWTNNDVINTICLDGPVKGSELYGLFVNNVVNLLCKNTTRDFREIKTLCRVEFPNFYMHYMQRYMEFVKLKEGIEHDLTVEDLTENFELDRQVISSFLASYIKPLANKYGNKSLLGSTETKVDRRVVINTSIMMIAVYIAAYTKPSDDKRNFVLFQKRKVSRPKESESIDKARPFSLERLVHIYDGLVCSIKGEQKGEILYDSTMGDIQLLEDLNIIKMVSGDGIKADTRFKISSTVRREHVAKLANQIRFDMNSIYGLLYFHPPPLNDD